MSVEKVQTLRTQSREIIRNQKDEIKKIKEDLFLLGKNYEALRFGEFRKKFRALIFSLDLEKYQNEISEKLSETENLIKEIQNQASTIQSNENTLESLLTTQEFLKKQQNALETFSESILALRHAPLTKFFGKTDSAQINLFKQYMLTTLRKKQKKFPTLENRITSDDKYDRFFSIKLTVHLGILSPYNYGNSQVNPLIQLVLNGFVDNKIEHYKQEIAQYRIRERGIPTKTARFKADMEALARGDQPSLQLPPVFSFSLNKMQ